MFGRLFFGGWIQPPHFNQSFQRVAVGSTPGPREQLPQTYVGPVERLRDLLSAVHGEPGRGWWTKASLKTFFVFLSQLKLKINLRIRQAFRGLISFCWKSELVWTWQLLFFFQMSGFIYFWSCNCNSDGMRGSVWLSTDDGWRSRILILFEPTYFQRCQHFFRSYSLIVDFSFDHWWEWVKAWYPGEHLKALDLSRVGW